MLYRNLEDITRYLADDTRWHGIKRDYSPKDIYKVGGSLNVEYTLAKIGAERLWSLFNSRRYIRTMGALTGSQAVEMVKAGLPAIYVSGWQVACDGNLAYETYPDQSLYPANSVPTLVERINNAFQREDQKQLLSGDGNTYWFAPIVADAEAGFGGPLNVFELMKSMIRAGAAGVHFEDQLSSEKKCGHLGGKVVIPTSHFIRTLRSARLVSDVMGVPTILIARTDANSAKLLSNNIDDVDKDFIVDEKRTSEGFYRVKGGIESSISRGLSYAPYADLLWCETASPNLDEARAFAEAIHTKFPGKMLAYNCSPSFNWKKMLNDEEIAKFQDELGELGYKFQFITLAGFHVMNYSMFDLSRKYAKSGMPAYVKLQEAEFKAEKFGYPAVKHQQFSGVEYFDEIMKIVSGDEASTLASHESTEKAQF